MKLRTSKKPVRKTRTVVNGLTRKGLTFAASRTLPNGRPDTESEYVPRAVWTRASNPHDSGDAAERRAWDKKLHAGKKSFPCPTCVSRGAARPSMLSAKQRALGHQCDSCADRDEGRFGNPIKVKQTHRELRAGSLLTNKQHPEWGVFTAIHAERPGIWLIRGPRRNETLLYTDELNFWTVKPPRVTKRRGGSKIVVETAPLMKKSKRKANPTPRRGSGKPGFGVLPPSDRRYSIRPEFTGHASGVPQYVVRFNGDFVGSAQERHVAEKIRQQHEATRDRQLRGMKSRKPRKLGSEQLKLTTDPCRPGLDLPL